MQLEVGTARPGLIDGVEKGELVDDTTCTASSVGRRALTIWRKGDTARVVRLRLADATTEVAAASAEPRATVSRIAARSTLIVAEKTLKFVMRITCTWQLLLDVIVIQVRASQRCCRCRRRCRLGFATTRGGWAANGWPARRASVAIALALGGAGVVGACARSIASCTVLQKGIA